MKKIDIIMKDKYIIKPYNKVYISLLLANVFVCVVLSLIVYNVNENIARIIVLIFGILMIMYYFYYRYFLFNDEEYLHIQYKNQDKVYWYNELPLNPCNIMLLTGPIILLINNKTLLAFSFYFSIVVPFIALLNPIDSFSGFNIFKGRVMGYFETHYLIVIFGWLLLASRAYYPSYEDIVPSCLIFLGFGFISFLVNEYLRNKGLFEDANYFFTSSPEGYSVFEFLYKVIHVKYLFSATIILFFAIFFYILTFIIHLFN